MEQEQTKHFFHSKRALAERYGVCIKTVERWTDSGFFPKPDLILKNGAWRWRDDTVAEHERNSVRRKAAFAV
jgi:predicted site-specific integrase-resolvase